MLADNSLSRRSWSIGHFPELTGRTAALVVAAFVLAWATPHWGSDAISYWLPDPIGRYQEARLSLEGYGAFRYTPVAALPVLAFGVLPWPVFLVAWTCLMAGVVAWFVGPRRIGLALALPPVALAVLLGNVTIFTTASLVLAVRYPAAWLLSLATKASPVGVVWMVFRRDWRGLVLVGSIGLALAVIAELVLPGSWLAWLDLMRAQSAMADPTFWPRMLAGCALTAYSASRNRPVLLPVAFLISGGGVSLSSLVVLLACVRLWRPEPDVLPRRRARERHEVQALEGHDGIYAGRIGGEARSGL